MWPRFYYYMSGEDCGSLLVSSLGPVNGTVTELTVMAVTGSRGQLWNRGSAPVHPDHAAQTFQFVVTARSNLAAHPADPHGDIAVDDLSFSLDCRDAGSSTVGSTPATSSPGPACPGQEVSCRDPANTCTPPRTLCDFTLDCPNGFDEAQCGSCDFEQSSWAGGLCGWSDESVGIWAWTVEAGPDHGSMEHGHQLLTSQTEDIFGEEAVVVGPVMSTTGDFCLFRFWYHGQGGQAVLSVGYREAGQEGGVSRQVWAGEAEPGQQWREATGLVGRQEGGRLVISASPLCNQANQTCPLKVGLDDFMLEGCTLTTANFECEFEGGSLCNWEQQGDDGGEWAVEDGAGPGGGYLQLHSLTEANITAGLESRVLPPGQTYCFAFRYRLYGPRIGSLRILLRANDSSGAAAEVVWQRAGSTGNNWLEGQTEVRPATAARLTVEGEALSRLSPLQLDSFQLQLGECPLQPNCDFQSGQNNLKFIFNQSFNIRVGI